MNTKSIFKIIQMLCIFMLGIFSNAQSLVFTPATTIPTNVPAGSTASFSLDYTSAVACNISVSLYKTLANSTSPDYTNGFQTYIDGGSIPATATASTQVINLPIPGSQTPSTNLPAGVQYVWTYFLKTGPDANGSYLAGSNTSPITIIASTTVTDAISFVGTPPASVAAGASPSVGYQYTAKTADRITKVSLSLYDAGGYKSDVVGFYLNPSSMTTTTPVTQTPTLMIPSGTTPTANLPSGQYYQWEVAIYSAGYATYLGGTSSPATVTSSTLATSEVKNIKNATYPNPVKDVVNFTKSSEVKTVKITDLSGRMLLNQAKDFTNGMNVSTLKKGIYIITINGNESQKLIKN